MDCKTAQSLVIPYINDQLSDEETEDFLEHIENCKECYEELEIHFTVHYVLQKLDEDDKVSFNIPKMLKENLKNAKNRIHRRKIFHGVRVCVVVLSEILLLLTVMAQLEMFPEYSGDRALSFFPPGSRGRDGNRKNTGNRDRNSDTRSETYGAAGSLAGIR